MIVKSNISAYSHGMMGYKRPLQLCRRKAGMELGAIRPSH